MAERQFEQADTDRDGLDSISAVANQKTGKESGAIADTLVKAQVFYEKMDQVSVTADFSNQEVPKDGQFVSKEKIAALYDSIYPQVEKVVGPWSAELLLQSVDTKQIAALMACTYAYWLLKMVQEEYDKFSADQKTKVSSYSVKVDAKGMVSFKFVDSTGAEQVAAPESTPTPEVVTEKFTYTVKGDELTVTPEGGKPAIVHKLVAENAKVEATVDGFLVKIGELEGLLVFAQGKFTTKDAAADKKKLWEAFKVDSVDEGGVHKVNITKVEAKPNPAETTPADPEVAGLKLKSGKKYEDMGAIVSALGGLKLSFPKVSVDAKDFNFFGGRGNLETMLKPILSISPNKEAVASLKDNLKEIFDNVDDTTFAKAASAYYMIKVKTDFYDTYDLETINKIADLKSNDKYKIEYDLKIEGGVPKIDFNPSVEFTEAYAKAIQKEEAAERTPADKAALEALKKDSLIGILVGMSGEGEAILDKVLKKEPAGFFGFLIALVAGIKMIPGFEDNWIAAKSYVPEGLKPLMEDVEKKVKGSDKELAEKLGKKTDVILQLLANGRSYTATDGTFSKGLRFGEEFDSTQSGQTYLEVEVADGEEITFGDNIISGIVKDGQTADYKVDDKKIIEKGTYKITCPIPKGTVFSAGVDLKLVKVAGGVASPDAAKPAEVAATPAIAPTVAPSASVQATAPTAPASVPTPGPAVVPPAPAQATAPTVAAQVPPPPVATSAPAPAAAPTDAKKS